MTQGKSRPEQQPGGKTKNAGGSVSSGVKSTTKATFGSNSQGASGLPNGTEPRFTIGDAVNVVIAGVLQFAEPGTIVGIHPPKNKEYGYHVEIDDGGDLQVILYAESCLEPVDETPESEPADDEAAQAALKHQMIANLKPAGDPPKGWTVALAEAIEATEHLAIGEGGDLHFFEGGCYRPDGEKFVARRCKNILQAWGREGVFTTYRAGQVAAYIAADARKLWTRPPAGTLNVANGLLDLESRKLAPHSPDWLSTLQLPIAYDPDAECDQWERFIGDWFPDDAQHTPWELLAWLISPNIRLQKAALLLGNGDNGKSRFLAAVTAFLGQRNVAALSLQEIETSRWGTHHLNGKLANICPDLPSDHLVSTSKFKALTGGDWLSAEKKHGDTYEFKPFVRLVFSANQPPVSNDASRAFFRRWIVVPFDATWQPEDILPEAEVDELLARPEQLSGALNRALDALPDVRRRGIGESHSMREAWLQLREVTDPIVVWLETNLIEDPNAYAVKGDVIKAYNADARSNGWPVLTAGQFGKRVTEWRPNIRDGQKRTASGRPKVWYEIGLKAKNTAKTP